MITIWEHRIQTVPNDKEKKSSMNFLNSQNKKKGINQCIY